MLCSCSARPSRIGLAFIVGMMGTLPLLCGPKLSVLEGSQLVREALSPNDPAGIVKVSQVQNKYDSDFLYFEATWPNATGSPHLGNFAVDPLTGDVIDADS